MATVATPGLLNKVTSAFNRLLRHHLLASNCGISMAMGAAGDAVQQQWDLSRRTAQTWSFTRTWHMTIAGLTTGVTCHYWYLFLDRRIPLRCARSVVKKVLLDQIVFSPIWISVYFISLGLLEGSCSNVIKEELLEKGGRIYLVEWLVWPPAQAFNFSVLPTRYRVAFDSVISFGFDIYTPYIKYCTGKYVDEESSTDTDRIEEKDVDLLPV